MNFFKHFPTTPYRLGNIEMQIRNFTAHVVILEKLKENLTVLYDYVIRDGERPDTVATSVYGSPEYTWMILLVNNIMSLYDWPLTVEQFEQYIVTKYGTSITAQQRFTYRNAAGLIVDADTFNELPANDRGTMTTVYDEELQANETKRRIKIIPPEFAGPIMVELKKILQ